MPFLYELKIALKVHLSVQRSKHQYWIPILKLKEFTLYENSIKEIFEKLTLKWL